MAVKDLARVIEEEFDVGFIIPEEAAGENKKDEQESRDEEELDESAEYGKDQSLKETS